MSSHISVRALVAAGRRHPGFGVDTRARQNAAPSACAVRRSAEVAVSPAAGIEKRGPVVWKPRQTGNAPMPGSCCSQIPPTCHAMLRTAAVAVPPRNGHIRCAQRCADIHRATRRHHRPAARVVAWPLCGDKSPRWMRRRTLVVNRRQVGNDRKCARGQRRSMYSCPDARKPSRVGASLAGLLESNRKAVATGAHTPGACQDCGRIGPPEKTPEERQRQAQPH
jgi:hypothetical protein